MEHIKNPEILKKKIEKIKQEGINKLHIVSDFDRTLTNPFLDRRKAPSSIALIREGGYLTPEYVPKAFALFDKYHPIEIDEKIPQEIKNQKMHEWWSKHIKLISESGMNKEVIKDIMKKYKNIFRKKALELLDLLHELNIPTLIFSSGVGDLIEGFLKQENKFYKNIFIISNFFDYDENGNVKGYKSDIVHTFNKSEVQLKNKPYLEKIKKRKNVILLGDSLGDLGMTQGISHETIIRICFLNNKNKLKIFKDKFDVVISNGSTDYVISLIKKLT